MRFVGQNGVGSLNEESGLSDSQILQNCASHAITGALFETFGFLTGYYGYDTTPSNTVTSVIISNSSGQHQEL